MSPGRELDALVAEKVMGWRDIGYIPYLPSDATGRPPLNPETNELYPTPFLPLPKYSTDIAAAWEVVEKLRANRHSCFLSTHVSGVHRACFVYGSEPVGGESIPHAICLAALKAIESKT